MLKVKDSFPNKTIKRKNERDMIGSAANPFKFSLNLLKRN